MIKCLSSYYSEFSTWRLSPMKLKIWGSRGSLPSPMQPDELKTRFLELFKGYEEAQELSKNLTPQEYINSIHSGLNFGYGGDTTCVGLTNNAGQKIFIDAGSGFRRAGLDLMKGPCGQGKGVVHIYFTHFHWDHLMGLPFFVPMFIPGNEINFYSVEPELEETIRMLFCKPHFPVPFEGLLSDIKFHRVEGRKKVNINGFDVTPYKLDHPDPCWGAKSKLIIQLTLIVLTMREFELVRRN